MGEYIQLVHLRQILQDKELLGSLILDKGYAMIDKNRETGKDTIIHEEMSSEKREEILRELEEESKNLKEWIE